jgi:tRNA(adenine34) deaminase
MAKDHESFMRVALEEAAKARGQGNVAVGALLVRKEEILARGHNEVNTLFDIAAHAETGLIRNMFMDLKEQNPHFETGAGPLGDCVLYTTVEPCPMCAWVICISGIPTVVLGARHAQLGTDVGGYAIETFLKTTGRKINVITGVLTKECTAMRRSGALTPPRR